MAKKFLILLLFGFVTLAIFSLAAGLWWNYAGARKVQKYINENYHLDFIYERPDSSMVGKFSYKNVVIKKPQLAVDFVSFIIHPIKLLNPFDQTPFVSVLFQGAKLEVPISSFNQHGMPGFSFRSIPSFNVIVEGSSLRITHRESSLSFMNISGVVHLAGHRIEAQFRDENLKQGDVKLNFELEPSSFSWVAELSMDKREVSDLARFGSLFVVFPGELSGRINGHLKFSSKKEWSFQWWTSEVQWKKEAGLSALGFKGEWSGSNRLIEIKKMIVNDGLLVLGTLSPPWQNPQMKLTLQGKDINAVDMAGAFIRINRDDLGLNTAVDALVSGAAFAPVIEGTVSIDPRMGPVFLPTLIGRVSYSPQKFQANGNFSGGEYEFVRALDNTFTFKMKEVSIQSIGLQNKWSNVKGHLGAEMSVSFLNETPLIQGGFQVDNFSWGRLEGYDRLIGFIEATPRKIKVVTVDNSLTILANRKGPSIEIDRFQMNLSSGSSIWAQGNVDVYKKTYQLLFRGNNIQPDVWPPLVQHYPNITGFLSFDGNISKQTADTLQANGNLEFHNLQFVSQGRLWEGNARLNLDQHEISLDSIDVKGGYSGHLRKFLASTHGGGWRLSMALNEADPMLFADLFQSSQAVSGAITGGIDLEFNDQGMVGHSSCVWQNASINSWTANSVTLKAQLNPTEFKVDDFWIIKNEKALRADAKGIRKGSYWNIASQVQLQEWGSDIIRFNGELDVNSVLSIPGKKISGTYASSTLMLNDYPLESARGSFEANKKTISFNGQLNDTIKFDVSHNNNSSTLGATVKVDSLEVKAFFSRLFPNVGSEIFTEGRMSTEMVFQGPLNNLHAEGGLSLSNALWRKEPFSAKAEIAYSSSTFVIHTSTLTFLSGGHVNLAGYSNSQHDIMVNGKASNLSLNPVFHWLRWPVKCEGQIDGEFLFSETDSARQIDISFDGTHKGFGPFQEKGALRGKLSGRDGEWDLADIRVTFGDGFIHALEGSRLFIDREGSGRIRTLVNIRNLHAGILTFFGQSEITGVWGKKNTFDTDGTHYVDLDIYARPLWINQFLLNGNVTHLAIKKGHLEFSPIEGSKQQLSGTLNFEKFPQMHVSQLRLVEAGGEQFFLDGEVGQDKWDFSLRANSIDAGIVRGLLDNRLPLSGPMNVELDASGSLQNPQLKGKASMVSGRFWKIPLDSASCLISLNNGIMAITDFVANRRNGYDIKGSIELGTNINETSELFEPRFDLTLTNGNLKVLADIFPTIKKSKGSYQAKLFSNHDPNKRSIDGFLEVTDISLQTSAHIPSLKSPFFRLDLNQGQVQLTTSTIKMGAGVALLGGYFSLAGDQIDDADIRLKSISEKGLSVRVPELSIEPGQVLGRFSALRNKLADASRGQARVNLRYHFSQPENNPTISGDVELENAVLTYPPSRRGSHRANSRHRSTLFPSPIWWDIRLTAGDRVRYENDLVNARIRGALSFWGPSNELIVNGRISSHQGAIVYSGKEFKLDDALIEIARSTQPMLGELRESPKTDVYLKAKAEREVFYTDALGNGNQDTITMIVDRSLLGEIQPRFLSKNNPSMTSEKALQLALGFHVADMRNDNPMMVNQPATASSQEEMDQFLRSGLVQLVDSSFASPLARTIARQTGLVDFIRVTYQPDELDAPGPAEKGGVDPLTKNDPNQNQLLRYMKGTKVKMGREVSNRIFADYSVEVDEYENQLDFRHEVELAYRIKNNLFIRAISELDSSRTLGREPDRRALLENQWRFGLPKKRKPNVADNQ